MAVSDDIKEAFEKFKRHPSIIIPYFFWTTMLYVALAAILALSGIAGILLEAQGLLGAGASGATIDSYLADRLDAETIQSWFSPGNLLLAFLTLIIYKLIDWYTAAAVLSSITVMHTGKRYSLRTIFKTTNTYYWRYAGLRLLYDLILLAPMLLLVPAMLLVLVQPLAAAILLLLLIIIYIIYVIVLSSKLIIISPTLFLEDESVTGAMKQGYRNTRGKFGQALAILVVFAAITGVINQQGTGAAIAGILDVIMAASIAQIVIGTIIVLLAVLITAAVLAYMDLLLFELYGLFTPEPKHS